MALFRKSYTAKLKFNVVLYVNKNATRVAANYFEVNDMIRRWKNEQHVLITTKQTKKVCLSYFFHH